jgi:hypothetical protein
MRETFLRNQAISRKNVQWKHFGPSEATLEMQDAMKEAYPFLFSSRGQSLKIIEHRGQCFSKGDAM